jgi:hypothetical protein
MGRRARYKHFVEAAKEEALLACDLYNERRRARNLEAFFVHMCIAWNNLLQAVFERDDVCYFYREADGRRFKRVDGEKKSWDLHHAISHYIAGENDPVRRNIEFFIGLRNKVEHRLDEAQQRAVGDLVAGKSQSLVRNFEAVLVKEFGTAESLAERLHLPLFLSSLTDDAVKSIKAIRARIPTGVVSYIERFDAAVGEDVAGNPNYEFRVILIPKVGNKTNNDMAIEFINVNALDAEKRAEFEEALVLVRDRHVEVANQNRLKPGEVVKAIKAAGYQNFTSNDHIIAWRHFAVRPASSAANKANTLAKYCVWDRAHNDYLYTEAWVKKLIAELGADPKAALDSWKPVRAATATFTASAVIVAARPGRAGG